MASGDMRIRSGGRRGFTLIEVLVVVAIIALLISILLPTLRAARDSGRAAVCAANLHQASIALATFENEHNGYRPRAGTVTSMQWIMLITRQVGDKRKYEHVNQVPVERFPVFQCPARTLTLPNPYIDYVLNGFDVNASDKTTYPEIQKPTPASDWKYPAEVLMVGDAALECRVDLSPCPHDPIGADDGTMRHNRENHPHAMTLSLDDVTNHFNAATDASLDRMDLFNPSQVQSSPGRRPGTVTHLRSFANWDYADGHVASVKWLGGRRTQKEWVKMFGVKNP
jgi:prepilin-type N-terminal cleavage/methylation domain-containing protein